MMNKTRIAYWERTVPEQPLRWGANVLFRHPPHVPAAERAALGAARDWLGKRSSPLTLGPSPALRERGGLWKRYR